MIFVQEVYFGKSPILLEIESLMDEYRNKYMNRYNVPLGCNSDPLLLKINRLFEEQFGFGCFSLTIVNQPIANAFTFPVHYNWDVVNSNKQLIADKKGFKFNKDADYSCMVSVYSGIIFNPGYTTEEIVAMIMHEIGHNFYAAMNIKNTVMSDAFTILVMIETLIANIEYPVDIVLTPLLFSNNYKKIQIRFDRFLAENVSFVKKISDFYSGAINVLKTVKRSIFKVSDLLSLGFGRYSKLLFYMLPSSIARFIMLPMGLNDEKTADNFATMFGYGPALSSALTKLGSYNAKKPGVIEEFYNKIPIISNIYAFNNDVTMLAITIFDEHPNTVSRLNDQLDLLEREVKKQDIDPKMKKQIQKDINKCIEEIDKLTDIHKSLANKDLLRSCYYKALYKYTDSKDLKDALFNDKNRFDQYDKTYAQKGGNN